MHTSTFTYIIEKIVKLRSHCVGETAVRARAIAPTYRVMRKYAEEFTFAPITAVVSHVWPDNRRGPKRDYASDTRTHPHLVRGQFR